MSNLNLSYLKYYFDNYLVKVDKDLLESYVEKLKGHSNVFYLYGRRQELLEAGFSFLSYNKTYLDCMKIRGYDLIEFFLNHQEMQGLETFYNISENNLIIYHALGTTPNNRLISLIKHVATFRALENKRTLILSEEDIWTELQDGETEIVKLRKDIEEIYDEII